MSSKEQHVVNPITPEFIERLDPQFTELYNKYQACRLRADQVTITQYRADPSKYTSGIGEGPMPDVGSSTLHSLNVHEPEGYINVLVYWPSQQAIESGNLRNNCGLPAHVNYHGGGWVTGNLKSDQSWCRQVCQALGIVVVDVDYRLAPEYPFPTQITDSWTALTWILRNGANLGIDESRVSIGGMASGSHIAAVLAIKARDTLEMPQLKLQLLVVPIFDVRFVPLEGSCNAGVPYESYITCENAPCFPLSRMQWFANHWLGTNPESRRRNANTWEASPILASSHGNLAPASIHCAEIDILLSEAIAYHEKLLAAGTRSSIKVYKGVCHPFGLWTGKLDKAKECINDAVTALRNAHALYEPVVLGQILKL
ncbi:hypothetical protein B7463_g11888, partial [Scytalidium lignicola]